MKEPAALRDTCSPTNCCVSTLFLAGVAITPETAAGNNPSSLGAAPPVTPVGPDTPVPGQLDISSIPTRAAAPVTAMLAGPDGPVPGANMTAGANLTAGPNMTGNVSTAGRRLSSLWA